jgi:hypothetical protein
MCKDWVAGGDVAGTDMDDLVDDLIKLELNNEDDGEAVGSDRED